MTLPDAHRIAELEAKNAKLTETLMEARNHIAALRDELSERDLPAKALLLSIQSHGEAPGKDSDRCFTARASHFLNWLRDARFEGDDDPDEVTP